MDKEKKLIKSFQVRFGESDKESTQKLAKETGLSEADIIRKALRILIAISEEKITLTTKDGGKIPISIILS